RGPMPEALKPLVGELLYGCDICQEVCPWNVKFSRDATEPAFAARQAIAGKDARTLAAEVLSLDDEQFRAAFRKSPIKRAKRRGLVRNAEVVLCNTDRAVT
ncbi:MAG: tRNA epoxyqueuosine(34) reductase QueG, partial [Steroidobacteraceae bacterium]